MPRQPSGLSNHSLQNRSIMCDCLKKSENEITDHLIKANDIKYPKESGYVNKVLSFSDINGGWKLALPFELSFNPKKADGTVGKEKKIKTNILPTFCPFCGVKIKN